MPSGGTAATKHPGIVVVIPTALECKSASRKPSFGRYVDDIIRTARVTDIDDIMSQANKLHPCLRFTSEREVNNKNRFWT